MYQKQIQLALNWLLKNQKPDGSFNYQFNPFTDEYSSDNNLVRQAGAALIISEIYREEASKRLFDSISKTFDFLLGQSQFETIDGKEIVYAMDGAVAKVNLAAFVIIIYLNVTDASFQDKYQRFFKASVNTLLKQQRKKGGFNKFIKPENRFKSSSYADGECFLSLIFLYHAAPEPQLAEIIKRHLQFFLKRYSELINISNPDEKQAKHIAAFFLWAMRAIKLLPVEMISHEILEFISNYTKAILAIRTPHLIKKNNSGAIVEGLIPAYQILKKQSHNSSELEGNIQKAIKLMLNFQITTENPHGLEDNPGFKNCEGGFLSSTDPQNKLLRVDYTQHCLAALILADEE